MRSANATREASDTPPATLRCRARQVAGLSGARPAAHCVGVSADAVLRGHAHVDDVALHQHSRIHDVLVGADDGEVGAVGRGHVDLAVKRILGGNNGARMADDRERLLHRVAGQVHDGDCAVGLVGGIGAAAVASAVTLAGLVPTGMVKVVPKVGLSLPYSSRLTSITLIGVAVVVGHHELLRCGDVFAVDRAGGAVMPAVPFGGVMPVAVTAVVDSGSVGWQVTGWPFWFVNGVQASSVLFWLLMTVMVSLPRLSTKRRWRRCSAIA